MLTCDLVADAVARSLSGNASRADETELRTHIKTCSACAILQARLIRAWALMGSLPAAAPLPLKIPVLPAVRRPGRLIAWGSLAAATLLALSFALSGGPPAPAPHPEPVAARPLPSLPVPEETREARAEKERIESVLAEAPVAPKAAPLVAPAPEEPKTPPVAVPAVTPAPPEPAPATPAPALETPVVKPAPATGVATAPKEPRPPVATLDGVDGEVAVLVDGRRSPAKAGLPLPAGSGLETSGKGSQAVLEFSDGTRVVLGSDSSLTEISLNRTGKRVTLQKGVLAAQVARQPAGEAMLFLTPGAEARVLGTRLTLSVTGTLSRLEVREGRVRLTRREDNASVEVGADQYAAAGKGVALAVKPLSPARLALKDTFERNRWSNAWLPGGDPGQGVRLSVEGGSLAVKIAQRSPQDLPAGGGASLPPGTPDAHRKAVDNAGKLSQLPGKKEWTRGVWLESRALATWSAEAPLRLRVRLWTSQTEAGRSAWLALGRGLPSQGLLLERRGDTLQLWSEGAAAPLWKKDLACAQDWETLELWIGKDQVLVRRNEETLFVGQLPPKTRPGLVSLGASCKADVSKDQEVRFDDVEAAWVSAAEFEAVSR